MFLLALNLACCMYAAKHVSTHAPCPLPASAQTLQLQLTLALAAVAVPINTLFGISAALLIARNNFPGKTLLLAVLDLPFSISPVVTGLMLVRCWAVLGYSGPIGAIRVS